MSKPHGIIHKEVDGSYTMYFCRGAGRCLVTDNEMLEMSRKNEVCQDCIRGLPNETVEEVLARIRGTDT